MQKSTYFLSLLNCVFKRYVYFIFSTNRHFLINLKLKIKQSHYRPGKAQRVLRKLRFPDFVTTAQP